MNMRADRIPGSLSRVEATNAFLRSVYNWMGLGLGITAVVAWAFTRTSLVNVLFGPNAMTMMIVAVVVELGLVFFLSARIRSMAPGTASVLFLVYSALNGFTLSFVLLAYTQASVVQAFLTTTGMFAATSVYGMFTKRDLSSIGAYATMALIGLLIAMVVNIFLGSSALEMGISVIGVIIFVGLTAYQTQLYKEMGESMPADSAVAQRGAVLAALSLYLNFINMFLMLLRLMGNRE